MFNTSYRRVLNSARRSVEPLVRDSLDSMMAAAENTLADVTLTPQQLHLMASILSAVGEQSWHLAQSAGRQAGATGYNLMPTEEQLQEYARNLVTVSREAGQLILSVTGTALRYIVPPAMRALVSGAGSVWELLERLSRFVQRPDVHANVRSAVSDMAWTGASVSRQVFDYISPIMAHLIAGSLVLFSDTARAGLSAAGRSLQRAQRPAPIITGGAATNHQPPHSPPPPPPPAAAQQPQRRRRRRRNSMEIGIADSTYQPEFQVRRNSPEYAPAQSTRSKVNRKRQQR